MTGYTYNTAAIFRAAHAEAKISARWDKARGGYRFHFQRHLREEWRRAKQTKIAVRNMADWAAERASRPAFVPFMSRGYYTARSRYVSAIGE